MEIIVVGLYIACELIANVTASKPVQLGGIVVHAAIFIYTLTFTLIDLINERFGKQGARKVIFAALMANLLLAVYTQLAVVLPPAPFYTGQVAFS
ncbi:MAG: VUT family protein, partial [Deltaproteobacteria bacterium]